MVTKVITIKDFTVKRDAIENLIDKVLIYQLKGTDIDLPNLDKQDKIYILSLPVSYPASVKSGNGHFDSNLVVTLFHESICAWTEGKMEGLC